MISHSHRKTCLHYFVLAVAAVMVVWVLHPKTMEEMLKSRVKTGFQMVFQKINRSQSTKTVKEHKVPKVPTGYWERNIFNFYDVPDPFSSLIGPDNVTFPNKYMIYRCDNDTMKRCGGWADRVKSMITVYLFANLTGRVFKAENIMAECDLQRFVVPNHVNWSLPVSFHETVKNSTRVTRVDMFAETHFYNEFPITDWVHHPLMKTDFVYIKGNHDNTDNFKEYKLYPQSLQWMHSQNRVSVNRVLFKRLFRPSEYLRNKLIHFLTENVKSYESLICAHLRMGQNPSIPDDFRRSIQEEHLTKVWDLFKTLLTRYKNRAKIFLMSDSASTIAKAKLQDFKDKLFVSPGKIVHVDLSKSATAKEKCEGFEKVILEQQVLLYCDSLVITDSGISRMASYLRGRDEELYCFLSSGDLVPCTPMDLKTEIYHTIN